MGILHKLCLTLSFLFQLFLVVFSSLAGCLLTYGILKFSLTYSGTSLNAYFMSSCLLTWCDNAYALLFPINPLKGFSSYPEESIFEMISIVVGSDFSGLFLRR